MNIVTTIESNKQYSNCVFHLESPLEGDFYLSSSSFHGCDFSKQEISIDCLYDCKFHECTFSQLRLRKVQNFQFRGGSVDTLFLEGLQDTSFLDSVVVNQTIMCPLLSEISREILPGQVKVSIVKVTLPGLIRTSRLWQLQSELQELFDQGTRHIILDFSRVQRFRSSQMGILLQMTDIFRSANGNFIIFSMEERWKAVLDMLSIREFYTILDDEQQAIQTITSQINAQGM